jgi:HlyD family secretion protein
MRKPVIRLSVVLFFLGIFALVGLVVRGVLAGPPTTPRPKDLTIAARTAAPPVADDHLVLPTERGLVGGNGIVEPAERETRIGAAVTGLVQTIAVKEGDPVAKDQVLVELDSSVEEAQMKTAEADVNAAIANLERTARGQRMEDRRAVSSDADAAKARAELSADTLVRTQKLFAGGASTEDELDRARRNADADHASYLAAEARNASAMSGRREDVSSMQAALAAARGKLEEAKATLARRTVLAPYAGEVLQVKARVGEYYNPPTSEPLLVLGDTSKLRVRIDLDERDIAKAHLGAAAFATADAFPGVRFPGKVVEIGRRMGRKNVRTDDPTERIDTKILEVVFELAKPDGLVPGLRVVGYVDSGGAPAN